MLSPTMKKILILYCVSFLFAFAKTQDSSYDDVIRRLGQLEKKVDVLTNEVRRLKLEREEDCNPVQKQNTETAGSAMKVQPGKELSVLEVRREGVLDSMVFTVRYWTDGQHSVTPEWIEDPNGKRIKMKGTKTDLSAKTGPGVYETSVIRQKNQDTTIVLSLIEFNSVIYLEFKANDTDQVLREIEQPVLKWTPPGDIIYEPGQDASLKVEFPSLDNHEALHSTQYVLLDTKVINKVFATGHGDPFENFTVAGNETKLLDTTISSVTFKTSKHPTRGLVVVSSGKMYDRDDSMLSIFLLEQLITLRASNQIGPFPPGLLTTTMLGFGNGQYEDGKFVGACEVDDKHSRCYVTCYGVGMGVNKVTVTKHADGRSEVIQSESMPLGNVLIPVFVRPKKDNLGNVTYTCEAFSNDGRTSREFFEIHFINTSIVAEESHAKWVNDTTVEFKCVFRTMKPPDYFAVSWYYNLGILGERTIQVEDIQPMTHWRLSSTTYANIDARFYSITPHQKTAICEVHGRGDPPVIYDRSTNLLKPPPTPK